MGVTMTDHPSPRLFRWGGLLLSVLALGFAVGADAAAPSFTGNVALASGNTSLVNLRAQGAIAGSAPLDVQVNAVRVGGVLSPLISIVRSLVPASNSTVCLQVVNLLGLDLSILGVEVDVTAFNAEAPGGVSGRITVRAGSASDDVSPQACADAAVLPPTANAGPDQNIGDTDQQPGENVALNGNASQDPDGSIVSYQWSNAGQVIATGVTPTVRLPNGRTTLTLLVTDDSGASATDTVAINVAAPATNRPPIANAGADRIVADTNNQAGESVTLDGTLSSDPDGTIASYQWLVGANTVIATGPTPTVQLTDGPRVITLRVTDNSGNTATDTVTITVGAANPATAPRANAGVDRTIADTDKLAGENVQLDGSASTDSDGTIAAYQWSVNNQVVATGVNPTARLPDGESFVSLLVTDNQGNTSSDSVVITVTSAAGALPIANPGIDRKIADTDALAGETVQLDGSASTDADGTIVSYQWLRGGQPIATGATASVRLPDGDNIITLVVADDIGNTASAVVQISVAAAPLVPVLAALPGLSPNQLSVAVAMDSLCPRLEDVRDTLAADQLNLLARCEGIIRSSSVGEQIHALDEITPQDLNATRTQTFNMSRSQLAEVGDRLIALRSGARGLSLAGLNINTGDKMIPIDQVASSLDSLLGGGASADDTKREKGGLLDDRLGVWLRGNYSFGSKDADIADHGFRADQWGMLGGIDYRFSPVNIVGVAVGYGMSHVDFSPYGSGDLNTHAVTAAIYGTMYNERGFYVDAIASYLSADYGSQRRIQFTEGGAPVDVTARGGTNGSTLGAALTVGYDFNFGGITIAPSVGYNYMMSSIDDFRENGAMGLDLAYEKQNYVSATANAGLRMSYAWRTSFAVVMPQVRGEYIHEFIDATTSFGVRFANDPFKDTPQIVVTTAVPDQSYLRLTAGLSAQFHFGFSGFVEYQRLQNRDLFQYEDIAFGVRMEMAL
jgi:outer membrane autotransporter protein